MFLASPLLLPSLFPSFHLSSLSWLAVLQLSFWWDVWYFECSGLAASWLYWVDTWCLVGRLVGGALVRVARALGLDSGNLC